MSPYPGATQAVSPAFIRIGGTVALFLALFLIVPAVYLLVVGPFADFDHEVCGQLCGPTGPLSALAAGLTLLAVVVGLGVLAGQGLRSVSQPGRIACLVISAIILLALNLPLWYVGVGIVPLALLTLSNRPWWASLPVLNHPWRLVLLGLPASAVTGGWFFTCASCFN